jgi:hypothetical protein
VTVFDNGNLSTPVESRAVEYDIDENARVATMVWEFRNDPPRHAPFGSNVQRLANGNTMIDWVPLGIVTEVRSDGTKAFEMVFDQHYSYRGYRFGWTGAAARPELWHFATPTQVTLYFEKFGDPDVASYNVYRGSLPNPTTPVGSTTGNTFLLSVTPLERLYVRVTAEDSTGTESPYSNQLTIDVPTAVTAPLIGGSGSAIALSQNRPNPFSPSTSISFVLDARGPADLSIYDLHGRLVRTLVHGVLAPGPNQVLWDGRDSKGRPAGSGLYFYRLRVGQEERTRRMVLLRR